MTTTTDPAGSQVAGTAPDGSPARVVEPADRGELDVRSRAVERIVVMAATEVDGVAGPVTRVLGQTLGKADLDGHVKADVELSGQLATVTVRLSVLWPRPITDVVEQVRQSVRERLDALVGLQVTHVDVEVTSLPTDSRTGRRVQ